MSTMVRLPESLKRRLDKVCVETGVPRTTIVYRTLVAYLSGALPVVDLPHIKPEASLPVMRITGRPKVQRRGMGE